MRASKFNVIRPCKGGFVGVNTLSKAIVDLDEPTARMLEKGDVGGFPSQWIADLFKHGFLVDDELDEISVLRRRYQLAKDGTETLEIVVALTTACNFACVYCFEDQCACETMSDSTIELLLDYIKRQMDCLRYKSIKISWYGGEPLLELDMLTSLAKRMTKIAEDYNVEIVQGIVTNGFLLNAATARVLADAGVGHAQVTIDGLEEIHDARRPMRNGEGTFRTIVENLREISEAIPDGDFTISLRFNADRSNCSQYSELERLIDAMNYKAFALYPAMVEIIEGKQEYADTCFSDEEFGCFQASTKKAGELQERIIGLLDAKACFCTAEKRGAVVVSPDGSCFNCWNEITSPKQALFHLSTPQEINPIAVGRYMGRDPFSERKCSECAYLPICAGGCPYERWVTGEPRCVPERFEIEQLLSEYEVKQCDD